MGLILSSTSMQVAIYTGLKTDTDDPQAFTFLTETDPDAEPQVHVILAVPCPAVMLTPVGTVQVCVSPAVAVVVNKSPD